MLAQAHHFHEKQLVALAREAGDLIQAGLSQPFQRYTKDDGSTVTDIDYEADALIKKRLAEVTPDIPVLSEEDPLEKQQALMKKGTYWCIDPLDGTSSACAYADGDKSRNYFGVLIGLVKDGVPVFGVAHYPMKDDGLTYYTNAEGTRAFRQAGHGRATEIKAAKTATPPLRQYARTALEQIAGVPVTSTPIWGNSNLAIAEGTLDVGYYPGQPDHAPGYWDVAAPHAILRAAGGEIFVAPDTVDALARDGLRAAKPLRYTQEGPRGDHKPYVGGGIAASAAAFKTLGTPLEGRARNA